MLLSRGLRPLLRGALVVVVTVAVVVMMTMTITVAGVTVTREVTFPRLGAMRWRHVMTTKRVWEHMRAQASLGSLKVWGKEGEHGQCCQQWPTHLCPLYLLTLPGLLSQL